MRRILVSTIVLGLAVSLAGCTAMSGAEDTRAGSQAGPQSDTSTVGKAPLVQDGAALVDGAAASTSVDAVDRSVVTTGSVTVTADDPIAAAAEAVRIAESAGGRVDARSESAPTKGNQGGASLTLRVPSATLTDTLAKLQALGTDDDVAISSVDVTTQAQDLDARITALRASVDRLTALLSTATDTDVLIKLESAISERQGTLESMEAQQRSLADQVSLSTIALQLVSVADAPVKTPDTFWSGLAAGWGGFVAFIGFALVALGVLLPWIVVGGVVAGVVVLLSRRAKRRRLALLAD